jgi:hypothetical protein
MSIHQYLVTRFIFPTIQVPRHVDQALEKLTNREAR